MHSSQTELPAHSGATSAVGGTAQSFPCHRDAISMFQKHPCSHVQPCSRRSHRLSGQPPCSTLYLHTTASSGKGSTRAAAAASHCYTSFFPASFQDTARTSTRVREDFLQGVSVSTVTLRWQHVPPQQAPVSRGCFSPTDRLVPPHQHARHADNKSNKPTPAANKTLSAFYGVFLFVFLNILHSTNKFLCTNCRC